MGLQEYVEVETKFEVAAQAPIPPLAAIDYVTHVDKPRTHDLCAIYFDTVDLRLTRNKITLRRRTGGKDAGWHIKRPAGAHRTEFHYPLSARDGSDTASYSVPRAVVNNVRAIVRSEPLIPIAEVKNHRTEWLLNGQLSDDPDSPEHQLAEFCDDHVEATSYLVTPHVHTSWREWEFELATTELTAKEAQHLLASAQTCVETSGATVSSSPSKLLRALGTTAPMALLAPTDTAYQGFASLLVRANDELIAADPLVRGRKPGAAKKMNSAVTKLQALITALPHSIMSTLPMVHSLDAGLHSLYLCIEDVEKATAQTDFLSSLCKTYDITVDPSTEDLLAKYLAAEYDSAHRRLLLALNSTDYVQLLDDLDELIDLVSEAPESVDREASALATIATLRQSAQMGKDLKKYAKSKNESSAALSHTTQATLSEGVAALNSAWVLEELSPLPLKKLRRIVKKLDTLLFEHTLALSTEQDLHSVDRLDDCSRINAFDFGVLSTIAGIHARSIQQSALEQAQELKRESEKLQKKVHKYRKKKAKAWKE